MQLQEKRNALASEVKSRNKLKLGPPTSEQLAQGRQLKEAAQETAEALEAAAADLDREARLLPNTTHAASPPAGSPPRRILSFGPEEHKLLAERMADANNNANHSGANNNNNNTAAAAAAVRFRDHTEIARDADLLDFEAGARVAGAL